MLDYLQELEWIVAKNDDSFVPDPIGYFIVRAMKTGKVRVEHYTASDEVTMVITGNAEGVRKEILRRFPNIDIGHYGYVCDELARAEVLGHGTYVQS